MSRGADASLPSKESVGALATAVRTVEVDAETLARFDKPGPRYTSYPTAVDFTEAFTESDYRRHLEAASSDTTEPLSLYVHLPFCQSRCSFCGCHAVVTRNRRLVSNYLDTLGEEARLLSDLLGERRRLSQYHWGGGTPTFHSPGELRSLHERLTSHFEIEEGAEMAVEVDPRVTTRAHLEVLRELGFTRLSMGVQDADEKVQALIGRNQTWQQTVDTFLTARELGFESVNVDLVYGLPGQEVESFRDTLEGVIRLRPDRLAVYSFAYVPWIRPQQRRISEAELPTREVKFQLLATAISELTKAGYHQIGMDHFALPHDELALANRTGTLWRNFMGYTVKRASDVVAIGSSGISDVRGAYAQNHKRMASYLDDVSGSRLPIERGIILDHDDLIRRHVIIDLMCNHSLDTAECGARFDIDFDQYFAREIDLLCSDDGPVAEGLVTITDRRIEATPLGRVFIRNVAMCFDRRLREKCPGERKPVFSRTL